MNDIRELAGHESIETVRDINTDREANWDAIDALPGTAQVAETGICTRGAKT